MKWKSPSFHLYANNITSLICYFLRGKEIAGHSKPFISLKYVQISVQTYAK